MKKRTIQAEVISKEIKRPYTKAIAKAGVSGTDWFEFYAVFLTEKGKKLELQMPKEIYDEVNDERAAVIKQTYLNAVEKGDRNVYFIDGEEFYGPEERYLCTIDGVHPNSLGFLRMANIIEPTLRKILEVR